MFSSKAQAHIWLTIYPIYFNDGPRPPPNKKHTHIPLLSKSIICGREIKFFFMCSCFLLGSGLGPSLKWIGEIIDKASALNSSCFLALVSCILYCTTKYTILYYTILYYTILYHTIPYHTIQYNTIYHDTIQYNAIKYNTLHHNTILYNTILYYTILYYTIQYDTIQYNTIRCNTIQYNIIRYIHYTTLHYIILSSTTLHCNILQYNLSHRSGLRSPMQYWRSYRTHLWNPRHFNHHADTTKHFIKQLFCAINVT